MSAGLLVAVLAFAVVRPKGWPDALAAVPAAVLVVAAGAVSPRDARAELGLLLPVVGFLAAVLVLAALCHRRRHTECAENSARRTCCASEQHVTFDHYDRA